MEKIKYILMDHAENDLYIIEAASEIEARKRALDHILNLADTNLWVSLAETLSIELLEVNNIKELPNE